MNLLKHLLKMLETKLQILDPQRLLETNLFVAALRRNAPGDAGFFIYERDSHPYDGLARFASHK